MTYNNPDLFVNIDTNKIDTFYNLTCAETNSETMLSRSDEEQQQENERMFNYFQDLVDEGVLVAVYEMQDSNGVMLETFQDEEGNIYD